MLKKFTFIVTWLQFSLDIVACRIVDINQSMIERKREREGRKEVRKERRKEGRERERERERGVKI